MGCVFYHTVLNPSVKKKHQNHLLYRRRPWIQQACGKTHLHFKVCIGRFIKYLLAKVINKTTSNTVISILNHYCHLHGFHGFQGRLESTMGRVFYHTVLNPSVKKITSKSHTIQSATMDPISLWKDSFIL